VAAQAARRAPGPRGMRRHPLVPIAAIAVVSFAGLVIGLTGDGWEDALAALGLALSVAPIGVALLRR